MALSGYLIDTSVMHRQADPVVAKRVDELGSQRPLYRCAVVELEVLRSATSPDDYERRRRALTAGYGELPITPEVTAKALETQRRLASGSHHRGVSLPDLIIAACAEVHSATVIHYDADYELIAKVTDQATQWVVPRGSVT